jgi:hypothetical protein
MKLIAVSVLLVGSILLSNLSSAQEARNHLANNTVLVIRHAEKSDTGPGLNPAGEARARLYTKYFQPFQEEGLSIQVDSLYAGADSKSSIRPRLTLEPLSKSSGMPLHSNTETKNSEQLIQELETESHGQYPLIAWRHGDIPALLRAFGASPEKLLPKGQWPDEVFDWVVVLNMGSEGHLTSAKLIHQSLKLPVSTP